MLSATLMVAPVSAWTSADHVGARSRSTSARRASIAPRSTGGVSRQPGRAALAAAIVASASATDPSGAWPTTPVVFGSTTS
ncbi:MAG TPA: hypothetical protein DCY69_05365 [Acidimicrobiaceae bacterium]|nr:hypothetical protein [Acidimicrobiaceae bacterium]